MSLLTKTPPASAPCATRDEDLPSRRGFARGRPVAIAASGDGCFIEDTDGQLYLDMTGAGAGVPLGRQTSGLANALTGHAGPVHLPPGFRSHAELTLTRKLIEASFAERVLFCTSASVAVEHAIRLGRLHGRQRRRKIVSFEGSFHGPTMGALAASDRPDAHLQYGPMPGLHRAAPWADEGGLGVIDEFTGVVILEPIQAAGGVRVAPVEWLQKVRDRCDQVGALLVFDESATGLGRTGHLWTYEALGVVPDALCTGSLAAGLPFHGLLLTGALTRSVGLARLGPSPATSPFLSEVALAVWERVADPTFLSEVQRKADWLHQRLRGITLPGAHDVRGLGLHVGVRTELPSHEVAAAAFEENLVVTPVGDRVIQLRPSLTVTHADIEHAIGLLECAVTAALWAPS